MCVCVCVYLVCVCACVFARTLYSARVRQPVKLMKDGWYMKDGVLIVQPLTRMSTAGEMEPKGLKQVLTEWGLLDGKLKLDCKDKASVRSDRCSRQ